MANEGDARSEKAATPKRVGDLMIPLNDFSYIPYWFTLRQAMAELDRLYDDPERSRSTPGAILVFTAQNQLLGVLRRRDILRGLRPDILTRASGSYKGEYLNVKVDPNLYDMSLGGDQDLSTLKKLIERPVGDFIRPLEESVDYDDDILRAIYKMIDKNVSMLAVIRDGQIVGMTFAPDVLREITKMLL